MTIELLSNLDSETAICDTLNNLITSIKKDKLLAEIKKTNYLDLNFGIEINDQFSPFQVKSKPIPDYFMNGDALFLKEDSDAAFFEAACAFPESIKLVVTLLNLIITHNLDVGKYNIPYKDEEQTFGLTPAIALIRKDSKYCNLYGKFLKTLNMDHTVYESTGLLYAFETYGCNLDTISLLAVSLFSASNQHSEETLSYLLKEYPINTYLDRQTNLDATYHVLLEDFNQVHYSHKAFYATLYLEASKADANVLTVFNKINRFYKTTT